MAEEERKMNYNVLLRGCTSGVALRPCIDYKHYYDEKSNKNTNPLQHAAENTNHTRQRSYRYCGLYQTLRKLNCVASAAAHHHEKHEFVRTLSKTSEGSSSSLPYEQDGILFIRTEREAVVDDDGAFFDVSSSYTPDGAQQPGGKNMKNRKEEWIEFQDWDKKFPNDKETNLLFVKPFVRSEHNDEWVNFDSAIATTNNDEMNHSQRRILPVQVATSSSNSSSWNNTSNSILPFNELQYTYSSGSNRASPKPIVQEGFVIEIPKSKINKCINESSSAVSPHTVTSSIDDGSAKLPHDPVAPAISSVAGSIRSSKSNPRNTSLLDLPQDTSFTVHDTSMLTTGTDDCTNDHYQSPLDPEMAQLEESLCRSPGRYSFHIDGDDHDDKHYNDHDDRISNLLEQQVSSFTSDDEYYEDDDDTTNNDVDTDYSLFHQHIPDDDVTAQYIDSLIDKYGEQLSHQSTRKQQQQQRRRTMQPRPMEPVVFQSSHLNNSYLSTRHVNKDQDDDDNQFCYYSHQNAEDTPRSSRTTTTPPDRQAYKRHETDIAYEQDTTVRKLKFIFEASSPDNRSSYKHTRSTSGATVKSQGTVTTLHTTTTSQSTTNSSYRSASTFNSISNNNSSSSNKIQGIINRFDQCDILDQEVNKARIAVANMSAGAPGSGQYGDSAPANSFFWRSQP